MIAVVDYGAGNTKSVSNALESIGVEHIVTKLETQILKADKIIIPGVGEASFALRKLSLMNLSNVIKICKKPILGICLGLQILCEHTAEGNTTGLGCLPGNVKKFEDNSLRIPHMGWNSIKKIKDNPLFTGINDGDYFYFAHSYYVELTEHTIASTVYGVEFCAAANKENYYGVQFHPEKSGEKGLTILKNFVELC